MAHKSQAVGACYAAGMAASRQVVQRLRAKVERGKEHTQELRTAWAAFCHKGAYSIGFKDDPNAKERTYYLLGIAEIPFDIPVIIGDAVHNLRSALDHLACHMLSVSPGFSGHLDQVCFPTAETPENYKTVRDRRIKGMRKEAIDQIDLLQPYRGGGGELLWHIHELDRIDKHRLLLTVYADVTGHSILPSQRAHIEGIYRASHPDRNAPNLRGSFMPIEQTSL